MTWEGLPKELTHKQRPCKVGQRVMYLSGKEQLSR